MSLQNVLEPLWNGCVRVHPADPEPVWHYAVHTCLQTCIRLAKCMRRQCAVLVLLHMDRSASTNAGIDTKCPPLPFWMDG